MRYYLCRQEHAIDCGMRVGREHDAISQRERMAKRRIDAVFRLQTADHYTLDAPLLQQPPQLRPMKRVRRRLPHAQIGRSGDEAIGQLPALGPGAKRTFILLVLHEYHRRARRARSATQGIDSIDDGADGEYSLIPGTEGALNIDDD
jgi:hypothetical protein